MSWQAVFCIRGLGRLDDCGALVVPDALKRHGIDARVAGATTAIENIMPLLPGKRFEGATTLSESFPEAHPPPALCCLLAESPRLVQLPEDTNHPRSLKATIALFSDPPAGPGASQEPTALPKVLTKSPG